MDQLIIICTLYCERYERETFRFEIHQTDPCAQRWSLPKASRNKFIWVGFKLESSYLTITLTYVVK